MARIAHIDHARVLLAGRRAGQAADVLGERAAPGERHREDQGIERRVIEPLADQSAGSDHVSVTTVFDGIPAAVFYGPLSTIVRTTVSSVQK